MGRKQRLLISIASTVVVAWSFLEATFWWAAPDISIGVAYVYFPRHWRRFLVMALVGAFIGSLVTYAWASRDAAGWRAFVLGMRFHSAQNLAFVDRALDSEPWAIVKAAWQGVPYKLFFGLAPAHHQDFLPLAALGLVSRALRFLFALGVSRVARDVTRPWTARHPLRLSLLLTSIWAAMIVLLDVVVNKRAV